MEIAIMFLSSKSKQYSLHNILNFDEVSRLIKKHTYIINDICCDFDNIDRGAVWIDMHASKFGLYSHFFKNIGTIFFYLQRNKSYIS